MPAWSFSRGDRPTYKISHRPHAGTNLASQHVSDQLAQPPLFATSMYRSGSNCESGCKFGQGQLKPKVSSALTYANERGWW
ncbi:hypothetical protein DIPPA_23398 [Diplonema papillatum]|nr:hypothetical protein DIPPA_23398 [Diplonema papillatum]